MIKKPNSRIECLLYILGFGDGRISTSLSRIEALITCLITGDTPSSLTPLSRNEKFLMAILGLYPINELPIPSNRIEVLLNKLAIGDSNLEDIRTPLSNVEELLIYIIETGGLGDFEIEDALLVLENGDYVVTEDSNFIKVGIKRIQATNLLSTEDDDMLVNENSDCIKK